MQGARYHNPLAAHTQSAPGHGVSGSRGQCRQTDTTRALAEGGDSKGAKRLGLCSFVGTDPVRFALEWQLLQSAGRTQATRYFVDPSLLRTRNFTGETTLKRIEPHRLAALVLEDLKRYPKSAIGDIRQRIGGEIHPKQVKRALEELIERGAVRFEGDNRWRRYWAIS